MTQSTEWVDFYARLAEPGAVTILRLQLGDGMDKDNPACKKLVIPISRP